MTTRTTGMEFAATRLPSLNSEKTNNIFGRILFSAVHSHQCWPSALTTRGNVMKTWATRTAGKANIMVMSASSNNFPNIPKEPYNIRMVRPVADARSIRPGNGILGTVVVMVKGRSTKVSKKPLIGNRCFTGQRNEKISAGR